MAVPQQDPINVSTANGIATIYPFAFYVIEATDLVVQLDGVTQVLNVDYTLSGVGDVLGGQVQFTVAPASGVLVSRYRDTQFKRDTDYQNNGDLLASTLNLDFDRLWLALQEVYNGAKGFSNTLRVPAGEILDDLPSPAARALRTLGFDALGIPTVNIPADQSAASLALLLASFANVAQGAGMVGYDEDLVYAPNTVGDALKKASSTVSVTRFGAVGDGVANDTAAFQAAIDYFSVSLPSQNQSGGTVTIPEGNFKVDTNTLVLRSGISLVGAGAKATRIFSNSAGTLLAYDLPLDSNQPQLLVEGILFDGGGSSGSGGSRVTDHAINVGGFNTSMIRHCVFTRFKDAAIYSSTLVVDLVVERCFFYASHRGATHSGGLATTIRYDRCYFAFCDSEGVTLLDIMEAYFDNCLFEKCGRHGLVLAQTSNATLGMRKCYFEQNNTQGATRVNLLLTSALSAVIDDCHFVIYGGEPGGCANIYAGSGLQRCEIINPFFSTAPPASGTSYNIDGDAGSNTVQIRGDVHYGSGGFTAYSPNMLARVGTFRNIDSPSSRQLAYYDERNFGESGTLVPTIFGATDQGVTTYVLQYGQWTRIGRQVFFSIQVQWSGQTGLGALQVGGLPFRCLNPGAVTAVNVGQATLPGCTGTPSGTINPNVFQISITQLLGAATTVVSIPTSGLLVISGHYMADA